MSVTIHPSAIVDEGAQLGEGTAVWHSAMSAPGPASGRAARWGRTSSSPTTW
jgi:UDP-2-acetamido-3-amino-2,3-dideoxy-glucuronate N-acetyltransferase